VLTYRPSWWLSPGPNHRLQNAVTTIHVSISWAIHLFLFPVYLSPYLHTYISYLSTYLPIYLYLSIHLSVYLAICLSVDKPISCLFTYLSQQYFHCDRQALPCKSPYNSTASTKTAITNMEAATRVRFAHLNSTLKCRTRPENPGAEPHPSHRRGSPHQRRSHFMQKIQDFVRFWTSITLTRQFPCRSSYSCVNQDCHHKHGRLEATTTVVLQRSAICTPEWHFTM